MTLNNRWGWALLVALPMLAMGCAGTDLEPAPAAQTTMEDTVVNNVEGVRVVAETDAWTGSAGVTTEVTPMKVTIENNSGQPLRVAYDNFALTTDTGIRYSAIPPFNVQGDVSKPVLATGYPTFAEPGFVYDGFMVAPYYGAAYPGLTTWAGNYYYDPFYYDNYYNYWADIPLPTEEMLEVALPEGVLEDGGRVSGFLYFEKVDEDIPRVRFRGDLENADTGNVFAEVRIPFVVEEGMAADIG